MAAPIKPIRLNSQTLPMYIGISLSAINNKLNKKHTEFDPTFPNPIKHGNKNLWLTDEIDLWVRKDAENQRKSIQI